MSKQVISVLWTKVIEDNIRPLLIWKVFVFLSVIITFITKPEMGELGIVLLVALVISFLTYALMLPNKIHLMNRHKFALVEISKMDNWVILKYPEQTKRIPAFMVKFSHRADHSAAHIRFPFSYFFIYSLFIEDHDKNTTEKLK